LFLSGAATTAARPPGVPAAPGLPTTPGATTGAQLPLQITLGGITPEGVPIVDLRVTVDARTNSLIVSGSRNDLDVVESLIYRLEDAPLADRRHIVYKMKNAQAVDVASVLNDFVTKSVTIYKTYGLTS